MVCAYTFFLVIRALNWIIGVAVLYTIHNMDGYTISILNMHSEVKPDSQRAQKIVSLLRSKPHLYWAYVVLQTKPVKFFLHLCLGEDVLWAKWWRITHVLHLYDKIAKVSQAWTRAVITQANVRWSSLVSWIWWLISAMSSWGVVSAYRRVVNFRWIGRADTPVWHGRNQTPYLKTPTPVVREKVCSHLCRCS